MGRKNRRWKNKQHLPPWTTEPAIPKIRSRCSYCGRLLGVSGWHWMVDEFGQRVRKCNDERNCKRKRKDAAEEAYEAAVRRSQKI